MPTPNLATEEEIVMKLIVAYIQPEKLNDVKQALYEKEVYKMSVTNALGCGQQRGYHESYRGVDMEVNLLKKVRLEIAVNEGFVESTVRDARSFPFHQLLQLGAQHLGPFGSYVVLDPGREQVLGLGNELLEAVVRLFGESLAHDEDFMRSR